MGLKSYYEKRDFTRTPEPRGHEHKTNGYSFVIQKHAATRLHYDFRLELDGVLKSWAVPKGPSFDPREKRLAVHVEDHPIKYGTFEGIIPKDEYGGGTVMLWDRGTWIPLDSDPVESYRKGIMKFRLKGEKLCGAWTLIRMKRKADEDDSKENWLLIKERDEHVRPIADYEVTEALPDSVVTGRSLKEIADDKDDVWHSKESTLELGAMEQIPGARSAKLPDFVQPELATLVGDVPRGGHWIYEIKFDGYRELCRIDNRKIQLISRNGKDWTSKFPSIVAELRQLPVRQALLDGEVVAILPDGATSFQALQNSLSDTPKANQLAYYVFDMLYLEGFDLRGVPLLERKRLAARLLACLPENSAVRFADHFEGDGKLFLAEACRHSLEGIICKRADRPYASGRGKNWLKVKCVKRQEFVVVGFSEPSGGRKGLGALLLAVSNADRRLTFAGKVGTGFTEKSLKELRRRFEPLETAQPAFENPPRGAAARGVHWVEPRLVAEVAFAEWTKDGQLRHPSFQGLREDKQAEDVVREEPRETETSEKKAKSGKGRTSAASEVAGVVLTHPERLVYPEAGITKKDLAEYYVRVADWIMPYVKDRPLTLIRCPDGWNADCFFQKHIDKDAPSSVRPVRIVEEGGEEKYYIAVESISGLIFYVQRGVLEFHPWGSRTDKLDSPDVMILDLDPDTELPWARVADAAKLLRELLSMLGLESFLKTTGGKGLHVVVPLSRRQGWDEVKNFSKAVVEQVSTLQPKFYTTKMAKSARKGRIYLDYLRNARGSNAIAPYSTRAKPGGPVAVPISWDELDSGIRSDSFTIPDVLKRIAKRSEDPWREFHRVKQSITAAMRRKLRFK